MKSLERDLRALRDAGRKLLVPYFMGGVSENWTEHVEAAVLAGADAVEIGIPFSDPMMDGPVIQEAALRALSRGTTLDSICDDLVRLDVHVPLIAMTYYNIVLHYGLERSAGKLSSSGISGAIVPDRRDASINLWPRRRVSPTPRRVWLSPEDLKVKGRVNAWCAPSDVRATCRPSSESALPLPIRLNRPLR